MSDSADTDDLVLHVDGVPVLWGGPHPEKPDMFGEVIRALGDRVEWRPWPGEFPLTGELLTESLRLLDAEVGPLIQERYRS